MIFGGRRPRFGRKIIGLLCGPVLLASLSAFATPPGWWNDRGVLNGSPKNDFGPVNAGQLKHIASKARDEFNAHLPGGAEADVENLVDGFTNTANGTPIILASSRRS